MKKSSYDKKVDMWSATSLSLSLVCLHQSHFSSISLFLRSLGVVLYLMLTGELPLDDSQRMQILSRENGVYIVDKKFNFLSETGAFSCIFLYSQADYLA